MFRAILAFASVQAFLLPAVADDLAFEFPGARTAAEKYEKGLARITQAYRKEQIHLLQDYYEELEKRMAEAKRQGNTEEMERIASIDEKIKTGLEDANDAEKPVVPIEVGAEKVLHTCTTTFERSMAKADQEFRRDKLKLLTDYTKQLTAAKKAVANKKVVAKLGELTELEKITIRSDEASRAIQEIQAQPPRGARDLEIAGTDGAMSTRVSWGPLRKGRTLRIQYLRGTWTDYPLSTQGSPDDVRLASENVPRLRLCFVANEEVAPIGEVPGGTATRPYLFKATQEYSEIVFNNYDTSPGNNQGSVIYRISIEY